MTAVGRRVFSSCRSPGHSANSLLQLILSVSAAQCNSETCCAPLADEPDELALVDPFKICTIPDAPEDMGGGELTLICLNSGGSLFNSCTDATPLKHRPIPPPSTPVCSSVACKDANDDVVVNRVCRFSAAYSYAITCDFWDRKFGRLLNVADNDDGPEDSSTPNSTRQDLRETIHTALQALAPKHFWAHLRRAQGASTM